MIIAFREIFENGLVPSMIRRGNKMYQLHVPKVKREAVNNIPYNELQQQQQRKRQPYLSGEIYFQDSFNLLNAALGNLPGAFGLGCKDKPFFPHMANNPANYDRTLPQLPPKSDYLYGGMSEECQADFDPWYEEQLAQGATFNLNEQLAEYCCNDGREIIKERN